MSERQQRYYDELDPEHRSWKDRKAGQQIGGAAVLSVFGLGAILAILLTAFGCAMNPPPVVGPMSALDVLVCGDSEVTVNGIAKRPDRDNVARFAVGDAQLAGLTITYKAPGDAVGITKMFGLNPGAHQILIGACRVMTVPGFQVRFELPFTALPRLAQDGKFISVGGDPFFAKIVTGYNLYALYLSDRSAFDAYLADVDRANVIRVWTIGDVNFSEPRGGHFHLIPSEVPDYYAKLVPFARELAAHNKYVLFDGLTGASRLLPTRAQQQAHLDQFYALQRAESNVVISIGNEYEQGDNQWCLPTASIGRTVPCYEQLDYPSDQLISGGSVGSDKWPSNYGLPTLQLLEYHGNDASEFQRKGAHEPWEMSGTLKRPAWMTETTKGDDTLRDGASVAGYRWYGMFQGCKILNDGCTFHSRDLRMARVMTPEIKALFNEAMDGADSRENRCRRIDDYQHRIDWEGPAGSLWLRAYQQGDDPKCTAYIPN